MTQIAASLMCGNPLHIADELEKLEEAGCDLLHMDVMDGVFVNNLALGPEWITAVKEATSIPLDIHLACVNPKKYIDMYAATQPEYISFHVEVTDDISELIEYIRSLGIKSSIAINPETEIEKILPYLGDVEMVLVMTVNPGFAGQSFNTEVIGKIASLREAMKGLKKQPLIEVDGNIKKETISLMQQTQPDVYVLGTSALFHKRNDDSYYQRIEDIRKHIVALENNAVH